MISEFVEYVKQAWKNKPNVSSPLNADHLNHMEDGIENNSKKIKEIVLAVNELTEKCTISYEEVEFEEAIGKGHTTAGDVKVSAPNHDSKILVGAKIVDYDGAITNNCTASTPVLTPNRSSWSVRIVNLSAVETTVKGKLILTFLG